MSLPRFLNLRDAIALIPDGALLSFGGFDLQRPPLALAAELVRQGRRRLRVVVPPAPLPLDLLVGAGVVESAEFGFIGFQYEEGFVVAPNVRRAVESGTITWRERDVFEIVQGLRAAAAGVEYLPAPGGEGTDYERVWPSARAQVEASGAPCAIAPAIQPDFVLLHAQEADRHGNLYLADPYFDDLLARAGEKVIATVERVVDHIPHASIPKTRVHVVVEARAGAFPGGCHGHYRHDVAGLRAWEEAARAGRFAEHLEALIRDRAEHAVRLATAAPAVTGMPAAAPAPVVAISVTGTQPADRLIVGMARRIQDGDVVVTGLASALPMLAVAVARATHAPRLTYINCVGAFDPEVTTALPTSVDPRLLESASARLLVSDFFDMARRGRIDVMFFGAAQVDAASRLNLSCIGDPLRPKVKLPGPAGSTSIRPFVRKVVVLVPRHAPRVLVERVDFASSVPSDRNRETWVVSDLALLRLEAGRLRVDSRHAGTDAGTLRSRTGFALEDADAAAITAEPTDAEKDAIERLDPHGLRHRLAG
ncbi:MAG TPA: CoA-transferase [Candidatus Polarisedimenticolia bacterium]|nr:CoA-transferase [Candidatus Polarisedimenticolia bacterium]